MTDKQLKELRELRLMISEQIIPLVEGLVLNWCCLDMDEIEVNERHKSDSIYYLNEIVERLWVISE